MFNSCNDLDAIMGPSLTILVPTYNRPDYTLLNVKHLAGIISNLDTISCPISLLVSDNHSEDDLYEALHSGISNMNLPFLKLIRHPVNYGIGGNILHAFSLVKSSYVMFCGDDDFLHPSYLYKVCNIISAKKDTPLIVHPSIQGVHPSGLLGEGRDLAKHDYTFNYVSKFRSNLLSHQLSGLTLQTKSLIQYVSRLRNDREYAIDHVYISLSTYSLANSSELVSYVLADSPVLVHNTSKKHWYHSHLASVQQQCLAVDKAIIHSTKVNDLKVGFIIFHLLYSLSDNLNVSTLKTLLSFKWNNESIYCYPILFMPLLLAATSFRFISKGLNKVLKVLLSVISPSRPCNITINSPFYIRSDD